MRIVTWNCSQKLDAKFEALMGLRPDVAIIPECAEPDVLRKKAPGFAFSDCEWQGSNPNKGLGVFAFGARSLRRHQSWDPRFHLFLPVEIRGIDAVNLLAVWAFNEATPPKVVPNPRTTSLALDHYARFLERSTAIVAGDFNAGIAWDSKSKSGKFADVDAKLVKFGLASAYHAHTGDDFDEEECPTHWFLKNAKRSFHIDYIYVPSSKGCVVRSVWVGESTDWLKRSDHAPVVVELTVQAS